MSAEFRNSFEPKKPEEDDEDDEDQESSKDKKSKRTASIFGLLSENDEAKSEETEEAEADTDQPESLDELIANILSDDEKAEVVKRYTDARQDEIDSQLQVVEHDSPEEVALMADEASLQRTNELIEQGMPAETASDTATKEVADVVTNWAAEQDAENPETTAESKEPAPVEVISEETSAVNEENDVIDEEPVAAAAVSADAGGGGEGAGGGEEPPADEPEDHPRPSPRVAPVVAGFAAATPAALAANRAESAPQPDNNRAGDLLLGGVVGYIIGRRGGRKRTERKLMPVQRELEAQVKDLQEKIVANETKITELTKERARSATPELRHQLAGRIATAAGSEAQPTSSRHETATPKQAAETTNDAPAAEAMPRPTEQPRIEQSPEVPPVKMDMREMLIVADKISMANVRVGELYRTQRIDAVTLRRVVEAYSAGQSFEKILREGLKPVMSQEILSSETSNRHHITRTSDENSTVVTSQSDPVLPQANGDQPSVFGPSQTQPTRKTVPVPTSAGGIAGLVAVIIIVVLLYIALR